MSLRDRIPVEPLDSARLDRLEQRIVAEAGPLLARPRPTPWASWLLAGTAALAVAALAIMLATGAGRRGAAGAVAPTIVATDAHGTQVDLGDAVVAVGPDTRFEVVRAGGGIDLRLARGDVQLEVPPRRGRPPLWVHAGDVGVRVVGTGFRVRRGDTVEVEVTHGVVEVHRGVALARVATGERWSSTDGEVVAIAALTPDRAPAAATPATTGGNATIPADELALAGSAAGPDLRDRRAPALAPGGVVPRAAAVPAAPVRVERPRHDPATVPPTKPPPPPVQALPDLRAEVLAQPIAAATLLPPGVVATTPEELAKKYREISLNPKMRDDADGALWGLAHTQATALGQPSEALRTLDLYVRRFPSGGQLEAVLWLRLRILCSRSLDAPCRAAAHTYVAKFPSRIKGDLAIRVTNSR